MATGRRRSTRCTELYEDRIDLFRDAAGSRSGAATAGGDPAAHGGRLRAGSRPRRAADGGTVGGSRGTRACSVPGFLASGGVFFTRAGSVPGIASGGVCCIRASSVPSLASGRENCTSARSVPIISASDGHFSPTPAVFPAPATVVDFIAPAPAVSESPAPEMEHSSFATARFSCSVLRSPQMAEQLVDVPVPARGVVQAWVRDANGQR